jgi:hypothetical protein
MGNQTKVYEQLAIWFEDQCREIAGDDHYQTAREWADTGLGFDTAIDYIEVGCWCPDSAKILFNEGIAPEHLDAVVIGDNGKNAGWAYASGIITLDALRRAIA